MPSREHAGNSPYPNYLIYLTKMKHVLLLNKNKDLATLLPHGAVIGHRGRDCFFFCCKIIALLLVYSVYRDAGKPDLSFYSFGA